MKKPFALLVVVAVVSVLVPSVSAQSFPTIDGQFSGIGSIGPGSVLNLTVVGRGGVPSSGVDAVAINVTATGSTSESFLTVFPSGSNRPNASNLNFRAGQTNPNMVIAKVGAGGKISIFNLVGNVDVIVDVLGWFPTGGSFTSLAPARLLESRAGLSTVDNQMNGTGKLGAGVGQQLPVLGRGGVPASGVGAVAVNVTATNATAESYLTVWPSGANRPTASTLNYTAGQTTPNMAIVPVGAGGQISLFNFAGSTDVIVDVLGWFPSGAGFTGLTPARLLDTRTVPPPAPAPAPAPLPAPAPVVLRPGTLVVGSNVAPGRYVANARSGCYWERLRGFSGNIDDVLANDFQGFSGRAIVDILPTDAGFRFDADCGNFQTYVPPAAQDASIAPGAHVIGAHIAPGTYVATARRGCYWERVRSFDGTSAAIIDNDFMGNAGQAVVTIVATDVGFVTDDDCGTWTRL